MPRFLTILFLTGAALTLPAAIPTSVIVNTTIKPAADGQRFLFLVDTSSSMEHLQAEVEASVYELIRSGIGGYMRAGDTYGMWTFNKQTYPGRFAMQVWDPKKVSPLGTIAAAFLSDQTYEKASNLKQAIASLAPVVRSVSNFNVVIISDGSSPMRGTPFDEAINADYRKKNKERKELKRPFVTTLIVRDGWFVNNSVRIAGQSIPLPDRPLPEIAVAKTNAPPVAKTSPVGKGKVADHTTVVDVIPNPKALQTSSVPSVVTTPSPKEQVLAATAEPSDPNPAKAQIDPATTNSASISPTSLVESPKPKFIQITSKPRSIPTNLPVAVPSPTIAATSEPVPNTDGGATNALASVSPTAAPLRSAEQIPIVPRDTAPAVPTSSEASITSSALAALNPSPISVAARELNPEPAQAPALPAMQAVTTPAQSGLGAALMLAFGAILLAAALFLLLVTARRFRPVSQGSLITQSMDTQTMQRR
jgi:hypothetical protein